jgi:VWFA-related protein
VSRGSGRVERGRRAFVAVLAAAAVTLSQWPTRAQAPSSGDQPRAEAPVSSQAGTTRLAGANRLVTVDLIATDARGRAITDLKSTDFDIREEGAAVPLESVRLVRVPASHPDAATPILTAAEERQAATADQSRLVAIFLDEYHVSEAQTTRVRDAIGGFVDRELAANDLLVVMKPLDSLFAIRLTRDRRAAHAVIDEFVGRRGDYSARNAYERDFIAGTPARIDAARNQVALSALNALAVHLGSLSDRRKTLIVVAESLGASERRRGLENLPTLDTIVRSANRANVAIYPFDPSLPGGNAPTASALDRLADDTTGARIAADSDASLRRAAVDASAYYLLSFRTAHSDDGQFRELQARVKRAGVSVRTRKGYWTASPDEALRAALLAKVNEPKRVVPPEPAPHVSPLIRPWFGMSRGADGKTRVTFVWEPAARVPGERVRQVPTRVVFTARSADGTVLFEGPVAPTGPAVMDDPAATPSRATFDAAPGRLRLGIAIQDAAAQQIDRDVREISIRDLHAGVAVTTPEILRARNAREFRTLDAEAAVPVASREFRRTEHLLIRFQAYGPPGEAPTVSARLLGRMGHPIRDLEVAPAATAGDTAIDLPLASFANGEYVVEVTARSGTHDASDRVTFRVTS